MNLSKSDIRKMVRQRVRLLTIEERILRSEMLSCKIEQLDLFKQSTHIFLFWSMPDEICTHSFIRKWAGEKNIYLPVMVGDDLELRLFKHDTMLQADDCFGIFEPHDAVLTDEIVVSLAFVPGMAFDKDHSRLGRGKGFYDRVLPRLVNAFKIGIGFREQLVDKVPVEPHDIKMDAVMLA